MDWRHPCTFCQGGDSGHVPSHDCSQNLSLGSSAHSSPHTSWKSVCSAGHFSLLFFRPHKSTRLFHWRGSLLGAKCFGSTSTGRQRPAVGETCNHGPCQGLGGSPLPLKSFGLKHHLQKQGLQGLFEYWLPAFLAKGVVVEECWQQC